MLTGADESVGRSSLLGVRTRQRTTRGYLAIGAIAATFGVVWSWVSLVVIGGVGFWFSSPEAEFHIAADLLCAILAASYAVRVNGPLDYKLAQGLVATALVFGVYALAILGGRFFFSRPMLASAVAGTMLLNTLIVGLRHGLGVRRIAVISPLIKDLGVALPGCRVIVDPATDLREFDTVLVSLSDQVSAHWARALSRAMLAGCKVRHVGEYVEELRGAVSLEHFEFEHLPANGIASYQALKRLLDIALVLLLAPLGLPVMFLAMAAIVITSGVPVFFVQRRVGRGGVIFQMWKLRTMHKESHGAVLRATIPGDKRITPVGRFLRRFRIDELPQLWNVLKGDMSLIGPRPEAEPLHAEYAQTLPKYEFRYLVRPGITGWAQVNTRPSATAAEARDKLVYDLYYVKRLSLLLDIKILVRTLWTIAQGGGAR